MIVEAAYPDLALQRDSAYTYIFVAGLNMMPPVIREIVRGSVVAELGVEEHRNENRR
ncbi:hypothetical protein [Streptomyces sp. 4F14]|uniref:hypothetical protein n=1 Tax=Streptomyces sp. 4F14 TaxID=3394380 RepID=UPI003A84ABF2